MKKEIVPSKEPESRSKSVRELFAEEEISLLDLIRLFTGRIRYVFIVAGIFFVIGALVAITSPIEYEAEAKILSEAPQGGSAGGLSGLAGIAGIQLPSGGDGGASSLSPAMYPDIVASEPFLLDLMEERFYFQEKGKEMSLYEYFSQERPGHVFAKIFDFLRGLPRRFFSLLEREKEWAKPSELSSENVATTKEGGRRLPRIVNITQGQKYAMTQLEPRISISSEGRIIGVKVMMPEPYISAKLNTVVLEKVIDYVTRYKTEKQRENLKFIEERTLEAEGKFKSSQLRLATFRDANQSVVTQKARTKEEQLLAEYNLAFSIYNGLAQQLEQTKIQLKKDTPLFTEFEPVTVPLTKAKPSIPFIMVMYLALGFVMGGVVVVVMIVRDYFKESET